MTNTGENKNSMYAEAMQISETTGLPFTTVYKRLQRGDTSEQAARPLYVSKMLATGVLDRIVDRLQWHMDQNDGQAPTLLWLAKEVGIDAKTTIKTYLNQLVVQGRVKRLKKIGKYIVVKQEQTHEEPAPTTTETATTE